MPTNSHLFDTLAEQASRPSQAYEAEPIFCYSVYHALDPMQMVHPDPVQWYQDRESHYRHVADVEASVEEKPLA